LDKHPKQDAAEAILGDFRNFLYLVWRHLNLPAPTKRQNEIAYQLQHGPRRQIIEAFRGVGKSWITSAFVLWLLLNNPQLNILVVSASKERASSFSTFTLRLISEMPVLAHLRPGKDQRQSKEAFDVGPARAAHAPSVKSVGITGMLTGSRADIIVADDVETPHNSMTQPLRDKLSEAVKEFDAILKPDGKVLFLGTPQNEMSLYNTIQPRGYSITIWPARYPESKKMVNYGGNLFPTLVDELDANPSLHETPTDPERFDDTDLIEREASYGRSGFALQFMLDTTLSDAERYPLKLGDLIVMDIDNEIGPSKVVWASGPEQIIGDLPNVGFAGDRLYRPMAVQEPWVAYTGRVMAVDPAGRGGDETSYAVVYALHGMLFLVEAGGFSGGYEEETLKGLVKVAEDHKVQKVIIESNFGDGMFTQLIKPYFRRGFPVSLEEVRHSTQKEKRIIDTLEPVLNQHRLIVNKRLFDKDYKSNDHLPAEMRQKYQLFYQLTRITKDRGCLAKDDRIDALAMAVAYWVDQMSQDVDERMKSAEEEALDQELEDFIDNAICVGWGEITRKPRSRQWIDV
jgi:hypothetical protein